MPDDWVASYKKDGNLVPGKVTRVFQQKASARHIIDVFGLHVTRGHVTICDDGERKHVPVIDILRSGSALVRENSQKVRACTNEPLGTPRDSLIGAITGDKYPDGPVAGLIFGADAMVSPEGLVIRQTGGRGVAFMWLFTDMLPKPKEYIPQRSALMLNEIYQAAELEAVQPQMPARVLGDLGPVQPANDAILQAMPPNVPRSMLDSSNKPTMNRRQRKAPEATQFKIAERMRGQSMPQ